jgi:hypothetical protein
MRDGSPEQRRQRITRELLHVAAVAQHDLGQLGEDRVDDLGEPLRVKRCRQPAEAGHVGEQCGDEPARRYASTMPQPRLS